MDGLGGRQGSRKRGEGGKRRKEYKHEGHVKVNRECKSWKKGGKRIEEIGSEGEGLGGQNKEGNNK